jgi:hypothetical protein
MARRYWKLRRFAALGWAQRALLIEAVALLSITRLALLLVPFPLLAKRFGTFVPPSDGRVTLQRSPGAEEHVRLAREIGRVVTRAARHAPFRAVCLPQAMAAQIMLRRRNVPSVMHFGAAKEAGSSSLSAHAWLVAAGVKVTGFPVAETFAEIGCFV